MDRRSISIERNETYVKIGLRRIGIPSDYPEEELAKQKVRKTQNLSKKQRTKELVQQPVLQLEL